MSRLPLRAVVQEVGCICVLIAGMRFPLLGESRIINKLLTQNTKFSRE